VTGFRVGAGTTTDKRCNDCDRPAHYDYDRECYVHDEDPQQGCFLIAGIKPRERGKMSTTLRITYEVVVPDEWGDPHEFGTTTAMELADVIEGALFDHPDKSVKWVGSELREGK